MKVCIVGGGLVGSLLSISLRKKGYEVSVFEKRKDIRLYSDDKGRSINMALSDRGWKALEVVGLHTKVRPHCIAMKGRMIHQADGTQVFQPYGKEDQAIYSISRNLLTKVLIEESAALGTTFFFESKCIDINLREKELLVDTGLQPSSHTYDVLFGTDGAFSEVRSVLTKSHRFSYSQWYLDHGYKELHIPPTEGGRHQIEKNALHIWPRGNFMLIALPNTDGSFTCTLFLPFEGADSFESLGSSTDLFTFFKTHFADALPLLPNLETDFFHNPTSTLINVQCWPWSYQDSVLLLGDAAHSIVPFYGQGMNAGFEDVRVFSEILDAQGWEALFPTFQQRRKENTDAIAQMALDNFVEMRDKVGDKRFQLKKKIDALLHAQYPYHWIPQYTMVTFAPQLSYKEAQTRGLQQDKILDIILDTPNIENEWQHLDYTKYLSQIQRV